ncbi:hypothetical protein MSM1_08025 [Mycobacterium sp. SM1]|uniref:hypothetical protein n=1 Tax=Mycobacterium sp. SM1 TaxID=2816243 RepID=UPI001BCCB8F0|nr:hypothetical protein [Mycobacterium sp. SM1]MBS4728292.1 hypothetical protein [Mycobacterium sp. SM1]
MDVESVSVLIDAKAMPAEGLLAERMAGSSTAAVTAPPRASLPTVVIAADVQHEALAAPLDFRSPRYYPPSLLFLEPSRMKREMRRL